MKPGRRDDRTTTPRTTGQPPRATCMLAHEHLRMQTHKCSAHHETIGRPPQATCIEAHEHLRMEAHKWSRDDETIGRAPRGRPLMLHKCRRKICRRKNCRPKSSILSSAHLRPDPQFCRPQTFVQFLDPHGRTAYTERSGPKRMRRR